MRIMFAATSVLLAACLSASAQPQENPKGEPCKADIEKLCSGIEPGGGRIKDCLKQNEDKLSEACKAKAGTGKMRRELKGRKHDLVKKLEEECKGDVEKLCKDIPPGEGRMKKCLNRNEADLSEPCKQTYTALMATFQKGNGKMSPMKKACQPDVEKFCQDFNPPEGGFLACLKKNEASLSEACRATFEKETSEPAKEPVQPAEKTPAE